MVTLSWLEMAHPEFNSAVNAIGNCPNLDAHTSYRAGKIIDAIDQANKDIRDLRYTLCQKYGQKGDDGKVMTDETGMIQFESADKRKEFEEEFTKEFKAHKVDIKANKLDFQTLASVRGITPRQWPLIKCIVDNMPEDEPVAPAPEEPPKEGTIVKLPTRKS